ncbi:MAG: nucleotidyltransferase family protein [Pseudomonadota bacterium]
MADPPAGWPQDLRDLTAVLRGAALPEDPDRAARALTLAVERHRLGPYLADLLRDADLPEAMRARLASEAEAGAMAALIQKAETKRSLDALRAAGCDPVLVKGWPLAERLYGSAALRHSKDLDLHIGAQHLPMAAEVIGALGYAPVSGHRTRLNLALRGDPTLIDEANDLAFLHPDGRMIELHWRLTHLCGWITLDAIPGATQAHPLDGGGEVTVLSDRAALIYLSVHGQLHMWGRLKWLLDIARLAALRGDEALMEDLALAEKLRAGRAVRIALALAHRVFATPLPEDWPAPGWLERRAASHFLGLMARPGGTPGETEARVHYHLCVMAYGEGLTQRLASPRYALARNLRIWWAGRSAA